LAAELKVSGQHCPSPKASRSSPRRPRDIRGKAIGLWAGASAITTALGPPLGGILIDSVGWRSVFWINLPLCAAALWLTATHVPESRDDAAHQSLDWLGGAVGS
jgi:MFS family permease